MEVVQCNMSSELLTGVMLMSATIKLTLAGLIGLSLTVFPASASIITFTGADPRCAAWQPLRAQFHSGGD